jgi:hypothetical protein
MITAVSGEIKSKAKGKQREKGLREKKRRNKNRENNKPSQKRERGEEHDKIDFRAYGNLALGRRKLGTTRKIGNYEVQPKKKEKNRHNAAA